MLTATNVEISVVCKNSRNPDFQLHFYSICILLGASLRCKESIPP